MLVVFLGNLVLFLLLNKLGKAVLQILNVNFQLNSDEWTISNSVVGKVACNFPYRLGGPGLIEELPTKARPGSVRMVRRDRAHSPEWTCA